MLATDAERPEAEEFFVMSSGNGLHKATAIWNNPLKYVNGKRCKRCGNPATCAILTLSVHPACKLCAGLAERKGYDVVYPEQTYREELR